MAEFPALPLWTDAYMGDCAHLSDTEHGRYLRLLMVMWRAPDCRIPNDDAWLARKFCRSEEEVREQLRPLIEEFFQTTRHFITQKRLTKEMDWVRNKRKKNSDASNARWAKEKDTSERNASRDTEWNAPTPTPTPTPKVQVSCTKPPDGDFERFWDLVPRKVQKGRARKQYTTALNKTSHTVICTAMEQYAKSRAGQDDTFTAYPAQWLKDERWTDQQQQTNGVSVNPLHVMSPEMVEAEREEIETRKRLGLF